MDNREKHSPAVDLFSGIPIVNICGYSNSGKTTLIEYLVSKCIEDGLSTAVMKHFKHEFQLDTSGKDTHRFFNAGATVAGHDSGQFFFRRHAGNVDTVIPDVLSLAEDHDLVFVEGHKKISLPVKIWLRRNRHDKPPSDIGPVIADLQTDDDRFPVALDCIRQEVKRQHGKRPLYGGLFTGSLKGGNAVSAAAIRDTVYTAAGVLQPLAKKIFLLGTENRFSDYGDFPNIPVFTGVNTLCSATLCAMHCHPHSQWLILDMTDSSGALHSAPRFIDTAQPGVWCVLPENTEDRCHPGMLWIDTRIRRLLETWQNFGNLTCHTKTRRVLL
jgi:molybdopterin-guanine dinucleotide biosynthesis adapter protein